MEEKEEGGILFSPFFQLFPTLFVVFFFSFGLFLLMSCWEGKNVIRFFPSFFLSCFCFLLLLSFNEAEKWAFPLASAVNESRSLRRAIFSLSRRLQLHNNNKRSENEFLTPFVTGTIQRGNKKGKREEGKGGKRSVKVNRIEIYDWKRHKLLHFLHIYRKASWEERRGRERRGSVFITFLAVAQLGINVT